MRASLRLIAVAFAVSTAFSALGCANGIFASRGIEPADPTDPLAQVAGDGVIRLSDFPALGIHCRLVDQSGQVVADSSQSTSWMVSHACHLFVRDIAPGSYTLAIHAKCQPDSSVEVRARPGPSVRKEYMPRLPAPKAERRYARMRLKITEFSERFAKKGVEVAAEVPANSVVDVLRQWPDEQGDCTQAIIRIVDAGTAAPKDALYVVARDSLAEEPVAGPSIQEYEALANAQRQAEKLAEEQQRKEKLEQILSKEAATGRCNQGRYDRLQQALHGLKQFLDGADIGFHFVGHDIIVATEAGTAVEIAPWLSGEIHMFALAFEPVQLDLRDKRDYAVRLRSPYGQLVNNASGGAATDNRVIEKGVTDDMKLNVKGRGCTLVAAFRQM